MPKDTLLKESVKVDMIFDKIEEFINDKKDVLSAETIKSFESCKETEQQLMTLIDWMLVSPDVPSEFCDEIEEKLKLTHACTLITLMMFGIGIEAYI